MATAARPSRRDVPRFRRFLLPLILVTVVLSALLPPDRRAAAGVPPATQLVSAIEAAYPLVGTLAVVVADRHVPSAGMSTWAARGWGARMVASVAGNEAADRPFPTASMVKLFVAEDVLHRARTGRLALRPDDPLLLQEMIRRSDDPAASTLWVRYGGGQM